MQINRFLKIIFAENIFNMNLQEAIIARHSVRKYLEKSIEPEKVTILKEEIGRINAEAGLNVQLVLEEPRAFSAGILKYGSFSGVRNYLVMAGRKGEEVSEAVGYYGEKLVLLAQTLGLNTCWVGLTYKKIPGTFVLGPGEKIHCVIALGYGVDGGVQHPLRPREKYYEAEGPVPDWFLAGVDAALLAPTAVNQQRFKFILHPGDVVEAKGVRSLIGYVRMDLGIAKYHFEIGASPAAFTWK